MKQGERYDNDAIVAEMKVIMKSVDLISAEATVKRLVSLLNGKNGHKGGSTTKERYGRQFYVDIQNKRWAKQRAAKNKTK